MTKRGGGRKPMITWFPWLSFFESDDSKSKYVDYLVSINPPSFVRNQGNRVTIWLWNHLMFYWCSFLSKDTAIQKHLGYTAAPFFPSVLGGRDVFSKVLLKKSTTFLALWNVFLWLQSNFFTTYLLELVFIVAICISCSLALPFEGSTRTPQYWTCRASQEWSGTGLCIVVFSRLWCTVLLFGSRAVAQLQVWPCLWRLWLRLAGLKHQ